MNIANLLSSEISTGDIQLPMVNGETQPPHPPAVAASVPAPQRKRAKKPRKARVKPQRKVQSASGPKRKHKTYLSATQIADRDVHAAFESRDLSLTLDINDLQQLIRLLEERRDLHVTRLMVARHQFENDVYRVMERYMQVFESLSRRRTCNQLTEFLSRVDPCMLEPNMNAKGSLPFFVWQWGCYNNRFHHWKFNEISTRIVTYIEDDNVQDDSIILHDRDNTRPMCGPGGCVVETIGEFTGSPTRAMVAAMFPGLLSDEAYTASLTHETMHFPTRMIVYFDSQGKIVKHVLEADAFAALQAIVEATTTAQNERFTELPALPPNAIENATSISGDHSIENETAGTGRRYNV